jgi:hypothetical protein
MSISIQNYVCNLIAGRDIISNIYYAVDRARDSVNKGLKYCYKINIKGIGNKTYQAIELFRLDTKVFCTSLNNIINEMNDYSKLDKYIMILLKGRDRISELYQQRYRALYMRSTGKIFYYRFINPYGNFANVNQNILVFSGAQTFLNNFCECQQKSFDPFLVINN